MNTSSNKRNVLIELLRIIAMLLIVACHFIIHFNWNTHHYDLMLIQEPGWTNALKFLIVQYGQVGVSIFFIISGYFLVDKTFKRRRIFKTWFQMFCYSSGFFITLLIIGVFYKYPTVIQPLMQGSELFRTIAASFFPFFYGSYWFISAYILMLLCAPFINSLCQSLSKRANLSLLVLFSFLSIQILIFGRVSNWNNLTYAIFGYLIGAFIKKNNTEISKRMRTTPMLAGIVFMTLLMLLFNYFASSSSPISSALGWTNQIHNGIALFPIAIGAFVFIIISRINFDKIPELISKTIVGISSTTFGIYLLHENIFGFRILWEYVSKFCYAPDSLLLSNCLSILHRHHRVLSSELHCKNNRYPIRSSPHGQDTLILYEMIFRRGGCSPLLKISPKNQLRKLNQDSITRYRASLELLKYPYLPSDRRFR